MSKLLAWWGRAWGVPQFSIVKWLPDIGIDSVVVVSVKHPFNPPREFTLFGGGTRWAHAGSGSRIQGLVLILFLCDAERFREFEEAQA